jgi:hypothetical protein
VRPKYWRFIQLEGCKLVEGLLIWRARTSPFSLILFQGGSSSPIYIPRDFLGIWSTRRGRSKPRVSTTTRTVRNSASLEGLALHWTKVPSHQSFFATIGLC